ncbi:hypothetical protein [Methylocucumis oryzae]|uniref:hypothetical protein n=1 Tax=Methylocucumis oryzae TaxID=1632867 RepID=UPI0006962B98|nr:hypothetical protein [Methylocucumis oryzae]
MKNQVSNDCAMKLICKRFDQLSQRCVNKHTSFNSDLICQKILTLYNQPARRYHNIEHIIHCLKEFDQIGDQIPDPDAVEMALWFHDSIYYAGRIDNEQKKCRFFLRANSTIFTARLY